MVRRYLKNLFYLTDGLYAPTNFMVLQRFMIFDDPNRHGMSPKDTKMQKRQRFNTGFRFFRYRGAVCFTVEVKASG
jgi:hypothetical protein